MHPNTLHRNHLASTPRDGNAARKAEGGLRRWLRTTAQNWKRRKMIAALEALDDELLADIGIDRAEIPRVAAGFDERELEMVPLAPTSHTPAYGQDLARAA